MFQKGPSGRYTTSRNVEPGLSPVNVSSDPTWHGTELYWSGLDVGVDYDGPRAPHGTAPGDCELHDGLALHPRRAAKSAFCAALPGPDFARRAGEGVDPKDFEEACSKALCRLILLPTGVIQRARDPPAPPSRAAGSGAATLDGKTAEDFRGKRVRMRTRSATWATRCPCGSVPATKGATCVDGGESRLVIANLPCDDMDWADGWDLALVPLDVPSSHG